MLTMDDRAIDRLAQLLAAPSSRRATLQAVAAFTLGGILAGIWSRAWAGEAGTPSASATSTPMVALGETTTPTSTVAPAQTVTLSPTSSPSATPAPTEPQSQAQQGEQALTAGSVDWGVNANGWNVVLTNNTASTLFLSVPIYTDNVDRADPYISPGGQGQIHGKKSSLFDGPADMNFEYHTGSTAFPSNSMDVSVDADFWGNLGVGCGGGGAQCTVTQHVSNKPVLIAFS
jgi:hypothetical protein